MSINRNLAAMAGNVDTSGIVGASSGGTITGEVKMWATGTAPTGYLLCDGSLVSRTTYALLFSVIGTTFGPGDSSTTFNLPNFRDRMPVGAGISYSANTTGGSKDSILVSHSHTASVTDPGHFHYLVSGSTSNATDPSPSNYLTISGNRGGGVYGYSLCAEAPTPVNGKSESKTAGITVANDTQGTSATGANLPPYIGIHFIIRTGL